MKTFINAILGILLLMAVCCSRKEPIDIPTPPDDDMPEFLTGTEMNKKLGHGINLGGVYEGQPNAGYNTDPEVVHGYISEIARLGFEHVRLPVNWERPDRSKETPPYTINADFMAQVKASVDFALSKGLRVILNMHNHDALMENPETMRPMFREQWRQIAATFKSYSDSLLFEILNEPHGNMTAEKWNLFLADALAIIRQNATPPSNNKHRCVLIGVSGTGNPDNLPLLEYPVHDPYTILTVHMYYPFRFTAQNTYDYTRDWKGTPWDDTEPERELLRRYMDHIDAFAAPRQLPVHLGEFGATDEADPQDRLKYTGFLTKLFTQRGYSWSYFNYHYRWGIYNLNTGQYIQPLVDVIKDYKSAMPPAHVPAHSTVVYQSNISASDADGWSTWVNVNAAATMSLASNKISVNITRPGTYQGAVQLMKSGLSIIKGRSYAVSFKATATVPRLKMQGTFTEAEDVTSENQLFYPDTEPNTYYVIFTAQTTQSNGKITIHMGGNPTGSTVTIEGIRFTEFYD